MADNARPCCRTCRFFEAPRSMHGPCPSICRNPKAQKFDRVMGWGSPVVTDPDCDRNTALLTQCDDNNWHEPIGRRRSIMRWLGDPTVQILLGVLAVLLLVVGIMLTDFMSQILPGARP